MRVSVAMFPVRRMIPMFVVRTPLRRPGQLALEKGGDELLHGCRREAGSDLNAVLGKEGEGALADAARDHDLDALLAQPAWQQSRLMGRRCDLSRRERLLGFWVGLNEGELLAMAEVFRQASAGEGNGNFHQCVFRGSSRVGGVLDGIIHSSTCSRFIMFRFMECIPGSLRCWVLAPVWAGLV